MASTDFKDEDLKTQIDFDKNGDNTPHRIHGKGRSVYWKDCEKVILARKVGGQFQKVKEVPRKTGEAVLPLGLVLICFGDGGKMAQELGKD